MPTLHLLGTGAALSDAHRTTTMLAFTDEAAAAARSTFLVDCGGDAIQRLLAAGVALDSLAGVIITHAHPDHVSGFPLLMEKIWLTGREAPLPVYGIDPALAQARRSWTAFDPVTEGWDGMPAIDWSSVPYEKDAPVFDTSTWTVTAAPVQHGTTPNVGLRVEHKPTGRAVAYSCDTAPAENVVHLAQSADVLVHEANGVGEGHSSAVQAAEVAKKAGAKRLLLVHLPPGDKSDALEDARQLFPATELGEELGAYAF